MNKVSCTICGHNSFKELFTIKDFPVYMGTCSPKDENDLYNDMNYSICDNCHTLQLKNLISPEILYKDSHNKEVIGDIWREHNKEFLKFCGSHDNIFEIGDPHFKMVSASRGVFDFKKWYIIEPNVPEIYPSDVKYIKALLDSTFDVNSIPPMDAVLMSHSFEHCYNPETILPLIHKILKAEGSLFISIPNMKYISDMKIMPPAGVHFEHSFYLDILNIEYLLNRFSFRIGRFKKYQDHSYFFECTKAPEKSINVVPIQSNNKLVLNNFIATMEEVQQRVGTINKGMALSKDPTFLFGAHFSAQLLLNQGLNRSLISGIIDNAPSKQGKRLYGSDLIVLSPQEIPENSNVICMMGVYENEIKRGLSSSIKGVKFL